jgi:hypothetical protein
MNSHLQMITDLRAHQALCRELLALVEKERQLLRSPEGPSLAELYQTKRAMLPGIDDSLAKIRRHREAWTQTNAAERARQPEITSLVRQTQDLILRVIVLDRENEQNLLRRGLLSPGQMPSANLQRPSFVASLYQQSAVAGR